MQGCVRRLVSRVYVRSSLNELPTQQRLAVARRLVQRRVVVLIARIQLGLVGQQQQHNRQVAETAGQVKRRVSNLTHRIHTAHREGRGRVGDGGLNVEVGQEEQKC